MTDTTPEGAAPVPAPESDVGAAPARGADITPERPAVVRHFLILAQDCLRVIAGLTKLTGSWLMRFFGFAIALFVWGGQLPAFAEMLDDSLLNFAVTCQTIIEIMNFL